MKIVISEAQYKKLKGNWKVQNNKLVKTYKFEDYDEVMDFVNDVADIAKKQNHHPDMLVKYNTVKLTMFDHEANDITHRCHKFTNAVDKKISKEKTLHEIYIKSMIENILLEGKKKDILINKLGLSEKNAEDLERLCGSLSVWMANKLAETLGSYDFEHAMAALPDDVEKEIRRKWDNDIKYRISWGIKTLNKFGVQNYVNDITSVMDWIRVGLNGNLGEWKDANLYSLSREAREWHNSLEIGEASINYVENNKILLDYRQNGIGFYWVDLETNNSTEECKRMGHCGRTSTKNTLYSLRETKQLNDKYTMNKSHLTAAVGDTDGIIYQMKGQKNSKPKEIYYPFIIDLLINDKHLQGFGSEYDSESDFKITDLSDDNIKLLYDKRPELFKSYSLKKYLRDNKIAEVELPSMVFETLIRPGEIGEYIDGDYKIRQYKGNDGRVREIYFFETLISGDVYELYDNYHNNSWEYSYDEIDDNNELIIRNYLKNKNPSEYSDDMSLYECLESLDDDFSVRREINNAISYAESDVFYDYAIKELKSCFEEYGKIKYIDDTGVALIVDLNNFDIDSTKMDELLDAYPLNVVFGELIYNRDIDKPKFVLDDRWTPYVKSEDFNSILLDTLGNL